MLAGVALIGAGWVGALAFNRMADAEMERLLAVKANASRPITAHDLAPLPAPVQRWLRQAQVMGKRPIQAVRLTQRARLRLNPEQNWMAAEAQQTFCVDNPGFVWKVNIQMNPLLKIVGRDKYVEGRGEMLIKLLGLIPVAEAQGPEIDQGTMLRFLAEMVWFPTAALSSYLSWEEVSENQARATMTYGGQSVSGVFTFTDEGYVQSFSAQRYMESNGQYSLEEWLVKAVEHKDFGGIVIPYKAQVVWNLDTGPFHWFSCELESVEYSF